METQYDKRRISKQTEGGSMRVMDLFRHGDVDGRRINKLPEAVKQVQTKTIMYGEVTGHHHTFNGQVLVFEPTTPQTIKIDGEERPVQKYIQVLETAQLTHQEHETKSIEKGIYAILQEQEYDPLEMQIRRVMD